MGPMLREESYHLGTGNNGLLRIIKANRIPPEVVQRFFNKWVPTAFDLFGTDNSSSAHWAYVWGLKGRFDERDNPHPADQATLNDHARQLYRQECARLVDRLNKYIPDRDRWLTLPDIRFNRRIGQYAHQTYDIEGNEMSAERHSEYLASVLPNEKDYQLLRDLMKDDDWIEARSVSEN
jgi:1,2-phenylacetyl-CoA epoxidase catalytic subunit